MARVVYASTALVDSAEILIDLAAKSGRHTAVKFDREFEQLFDRLAEFPESGAPRPALGADIRIGIVAPYLVIYRYVTTGDTVTVLRLVHGRRKLSGSLLRGRIHLP